MTDASWPPGSGEIAEHVRSFDWTLTSLGALASWPALLKACVATCLLSPEPIALFWGPDLIQIHNRAYAQLAGAPELGKLGLPAADGWAGAWDGGGKRIAAVLQTGSAAVARLDLPARPEGLQGLRATCSPAVDETGRPVGVWLRLTPIDTSVTQATEEHQHRIRNLLATMRSVVRRTARTSTSLEQYAMHLDGRLGALARVEALLSRSPAKGVDLEFLVAEELSTQAAKEGPHLVISGPEVRIRGRPAELLGLSLHELTMNAIKFGALSAPAGHVAVSWSVDNEFLRLQWREQGLNLPSHETRPRGYGMDLLERALPYELEAATELTLSETELNCTIQIPLTPEIQTAHEPAGSPLG